MWHELIFDRATEIGKHMEYNYDTTLINGEKV